MVDSSPTASGAVSAPPLDGALAALRENEIRLLTDIAAALALEGDAAEEDRRRLLDVADDLRNLFFLVVIIGEFNAGKSSFINALLNDELLPMGITPTTEVIELIKYGAVASRTAEVRADGIREWTHPNTGAPGVALVDTPGVNSVFQKHEATAKGFLHRSDLVIFVLSAKRAFAESDRMYLELAKNYGKKIILVLNQVDSLSPAEQVEVRRFVERQLQETLDLRPLLFMTSAKTALANRNGGAESGGVDAVRAHLRGVFSEAPPARQKLLAPLELADQIVGRHLSAAARKSDVVGADTNKVRDVQRELENQSQGLSGQLVQARAEIDTVFEGIRKRGLAFIDDNLSIRKIGRSVNRATLQSEFQEVVIGRALQEVSNASTSYINALIDNSRLYWRSVIERLNQMRDLMEQELSGLDASVYAEQREALEDAIRTAQGELASYSSGRVLGEMEDIFRTNVSGFTTGAAAAVVGVILTALAIAAPGPIIGVGAAALALPAFIIGAPVLALGGYAAYRYYRRLSADAKRDFNQRIDQLEKTYEDALDTLTQKERIRLTQYGRQVVTPIFSRLDVLTQRYAAQRTMLIDTQAQIDTLRKAIEAVS